ncbi:MAG: DUF2634 domain-containing protein [Evtepia sp.]
MSQLYPVFEVPSFVRDDVEQKADYRPSAFFDFNTGDFEVDSNGRIREATETEAWEQWCLKAVYTQRDAFLSYPNDYGIETDKAFQEPTHLQQQAFFQRTITNAILADPYHRTMYVKNFTFHRTEDGVVIRFEIVAWDGRVSALNATL